MAHKVAAFPTATRRSKYDVNTWFNGEIWKLIQGEDFTVPVPSFRGSLYNQANKKGFEIETRVLSEDDGTVALFVQKIGNKEKDTPAPKGRRAKAKAPAA